MLHRLHQVLLRTTLGVLACSCALSDVSAAERPPRREKILISEVPGGLAIPGLGRRKSPVDDSLDFLDKQSSVSGVVTPFSMSSSPAAANPKATAKMMEKLDQQKNWMFQNHLQDDSKGSRNEAEEALNVGEYDLSSTGKKKGSVQRYMERDANRNLSATNSQSSASEDDPSNPTLSEADRRYTSPLDRDPTGRGSHEKRRDGSGGKHNDMDRSGNLAGRSAFDAMRPAGEESRFQGGFTRSIAGGLSDRSIAERDMEFRKMLEPIGASSSAAASARNPLGGVLDPINLSPDLTRQEINPVTPNIGPDIGRLSQPSILGGVRGLNTAFSAPRPGGFLDGVGRSAVGSGLGPAMIEPPKPVIMTPQPGVLEIPRRPH